MNHAPTSTGSLYTCPACAFRAVVTNRGVVVTSEGDGRALHITAIEAERDQIRAEAVRIMDRLRMHYGNATPLPEPDDNRDDLVAAGVIDPRTLTLMQLRRLFRCVTSEFEA